MCCNILRLTFTYGVNILRCLSPFDVLRRPCLQTLPPPVLSGRSGLRRAHIPRSTRKCSGLRMPTLSEEDFGTVNSDISCRFTASGCRSDCTNTYKSRNQSREAGTSSRIFDSMENFGQIYHIGSRPPRFMGVLSTEVAPQQVLVMEQEIKALLEKGAKEYVPLSNRETGFYSRYFIVPKKDGGMLPILDLRILNESIMKPQFQNVNFETNRVTDQIRGLVCHDRSQGRILSYIHPSVSC